MLLNLEADRSLSHSPIDTVTWYFWLR